VSLSLDSQQEILTKWRMAEAKTGAAPTRSELEALAAFRHALRVFLAFSERNAKRHGLTTQQHQALLSIKAGYPSRTTVTVRELANHLLLKHHSTVELAGRLEKAGLIKKQISAADRRVVMLSLTSKADRILGRLSTDNLDALRRVSPIITELKRALDHASEGLIGIRQETRAP
jgi:DNA-binding MarR family transcriptional regulator